MLSVAVFFKHLRVLLSSQVSGLPAPAPIAYIRVISSFRKRQVFARKIGILEVEQNQSFRKIHKISFKITFFRETKQQRRHVLERPDGPATPGSIGFYFLDKKEDPINCNTFLKKCCSFTDVFPHICKPFIIE